MCVGHWLGSRGKIIFPLLQQSVYSLAKGEKRCATIHTRFTNFEGIIGVVVGSLVYEMMLRSCSIPAVYLLVVLAVTTAIVFHYCCKTLFVLRICYGIGRKSFYHKSKNKT